MSKISGALAAVVALSAAACHTLESDQSNRSDQYDVAELVVRDLYVVQLQKHKAVICFPKRSDPGSPFLKRLSPLLVAPCSSLLDNRPGREPKIEITGERAVAIYIERFERTGQDSLTVTASRWRGSLSGKGYTFKFRRTNGKWQLSDRESTWIS